jgi:hypothetical protein
VGGFEPTTPPRAAVTIGLRLRAASITVIPAMLFPADIMYTLNHGATHGARSVTLWPQAELAQRTTDAVTGV